MMCTRIPFWRDEARSVPGKVLELTCGTGRVSIPLLKAGVHLTCLDYSPGMLAQRGKKSSLIRENLEKEKQKSAPADPRASETGREFDRPELLPGVRVSLTAQTVLSNYGEQGFVRYLIVPDRQGERDAGFQESLI
jgi:SAM-dependent methyltransferase